MEEQVRKRNADIDNLQSAVENAGKEMTQERIRQKETYEKERQALLKEIETKRALGDEKQSREDEAFEALGELEDEIERNHREIEMMRISLDHTNMLHAGELQLAVAAEKLKYEHKTQRQEEKIEWLQERIADLNEVG